MGNWFGDLDLGAKYGIALAGLFILVMIFACTKLYLMKRKQKKWIEAKKASDADEEGKLEHIALNQREEGEGDLFGIRALEKGFTGGVAQSRPTTPSLVSATHSRSNSTLALSSHIPYGHTPRSASASSSTTAIADAETISKMSTAPKSQYGKGKMAVDPAVDMNIIVPESPRMIRPRDTPGTPGSGTHTPQPGSPLLGATVGSPQLYPETVASRIQSVVASPTTSTPMLHRANSDSASVHSVNDHSGSSSPDVRDGTSPSPPPRIYAGQTPSIRVEPLFHGRNGDHYSAQQYQTSAPRRPRA